MKPKINPATAQRLSELKKKMEEIDQLSKQICADPVAIADGITFTNKTSTHSRNGKTTLCTTIELIVPTKHLKG